MVQTCASKRKSAEAESVNGTRDGTEELSQKVTSPKAPSESPKRRKLNGTKEAKQKSEELAAKQDAEEHDVTAQDVKAQDGKEQVAKVQDAEEQRAKQPDAEEPDAKEEGAKLRTTGKRDAENGSNGQQDAEDQDDEEGFADFTEAMDAEKRAWQGFCEIESEPAYFNVMLKEFGVQGVKVQEVYGLDPDMLAMLPKPVYGLIFLFRYRELDADTQEATCPSHIWFANQIDPHSCATVAMLNIINNIPDVDIGEHLRSFKDFTQDFPPHLRGREINSFEFVKHVHNSFARQIDMLKIDLEMAEKVQAAEKQKKAEAAAKARAAKASTAKASASKSRSTKRKARAARESDDEEPDQVDDEEAAYHFSAYMPIGSTVWKLDGLDRQPTQFGDIEPEADWLTTVADVLSSRMAQYEANDISFNLMALVKDPLIALRKDLAENVKCLNTVEGRLDEVEGDWKGFLPADQGGNVLTTMSVELGISVQDIEDAVLPPSVAEKLVKREQPEEEDYTLQDLLHLRGQLVAAQAPLRAGIRDELESAESDKKKATTRRHDYGPFIEEWLDMLQENGELDALVEKQLPPKKGKKTPAKKTVPTKKGGNGGRVTKKGRK
ncbi:hypothetical protein H2199_002091 [Coniosporium tulheliwenetii]|uniref:Uncharacterized protein n=1 Tax=Coniosporium tulheliwenetii TaxID=3383036 RepID=A0ACC2ZHT5_9PEZI|nr:hypothetical protein H2199_002091 [Cladosporium sp. JES 115]